MREMSDKLVALMEQLSSEASKVSAAECMLEAKSKELDAALHLGEWEGIERARQLTVSAFENFLDAKIGMFQHIKRESKKL